MRYVDPDGRETYDSKITEEQYNNSYFLQQQMSWECVQSYFDENPNGVLHRPADQISFMQLHSKRDVVTINDGSMLMVDILIIGRGVISLGKNFVKNYVAKRTLKDGGETLAKSHWYIQQTEKRMEK